MVFLETRNLAAAERHFRQAFGIRRAILGEDHKDTVDSHAALAMVYKELGCPLEAIEIYRKCLETQRQALGEDHPAVGALENNLAVAYIAAGDPTAAEPLFREAVATLRVRQAKDDPGYGAALNNLARWYKRRGDHAAAEPLLRQALAAREAAHGEDHPYVAVALGDLADLCAATGRFTEALALLTRILAIEDRAIGLAFAGSPEGHRLATLKRFSWGMEAFLSLVLQHFANDPTAVGSALDLVLRRKALSAEAAAVQQEVVLSSRYPELEAIFRELAEVRERLAQATLSSPGPAPLKGYRRRLRELRDQRDALEAELSRQVPEIRLERQLAARSCRQVAARLPEGSALIEFVYLGLRNFRASEWGLCRYVAFVLPGGQPDQVQMIDLAEAGPIDLTIADFRASVAVDPHDRPERDIRRHRPGLTPSAQEQAGPALRSAVFDKLLPALGDSNRLLLAPDGDLARLPFEILPDADGRLLLEQYQISYLSCGRDVLRFGAASNRSPAEPLVVADPLFDLAADADASTPAVTTQSRCSRDFKRSDYHFPRLPGTRQEGERVAELLGVQPWLESAALEARLKERRSPRVLHLATHGFFLTDQERDPNKEGRDLEMVGAEAGSVGRLSGPLPENPLLRSGLALAGAQSWLNGKPLPPEAEDGLLTAEDVTGLDLLDTELVVLSACDTGLGEIRTGEGVLGLRRAFIVAGARTLVVSLWKVPDQQTQELMIDFYTRVLSGEGVADALRQAQLTVKEKYPDPYFWGAFICLGNPGPLTARTGSPPAVSSR